MRRTIALSLIALTTIVMFAQQQRESPRPGFEVTSLFPRETGPGQYEQVESSDIQKFSAQGWELVSVTPFIYRNEEHNNGEMHGPKPMLTQVYPAYFFRRARLSRN